jgi:DNA-binding beta-propeller fold protein YncE
MLRDIATGEDLSDLCSPAGMRTVFAAAPRAKKILLLKPDTLEIAGELSVDGAPERVTPDPSGQRIFVLCPRGNLLSIISLSDRKNIDILIPGQPKSMAYDAEKQLLYVASRDTGMLHVVDMKTTKLRPAERALPEEPVALALSPDGTELWTAQWKTSTVSTVDTSTFSVKGALILKDKTPCALAFSPDGLYVYAALFDSGEVGRFPVHREEVGKDLFASSGRKPSALAFDPRGRLWIANRGADTLACFNGRGLTRCKELKTGKNPFRIAFVPQ